MTTNRPFPILILALICVALAPAIASLPGCANVERTPQATAFSTLKAAAAGIDSFRADYEAAWRAGNLSQEDFTKLDLAYNAANMAIIEAAEALDAGMEAAVTGDVTRLSKELFDLVKTLVPSRYHVNSQRWEL